MRQGQECIEKDQLIVKLVQQEKRGNKRMGGKKLYHKLWEPIRDIHPSLGRDKFFALLGRHDLLVKRRRKYAITTQSRHRFKRYTNLLKDFKPVKPNQAWVGDITYIRTKDGFVFLFLLTDVYSRKIVGWHLSKNLGIEDALKAAEMAKRQCVVTIDIIHHTDRGIQYCAPLYAGNMEEAGIRMSMGEAGNCYDNAMAERVNGILKEEYALDSTFADMEEALLATKQGINHYNKQRPHWSLKFKTPNEVHGQMN